MTKITDILLNCIFPRRCPICDGLLKKEERLICIKCAKKIKFIKNRTCLVCGKPLKSRYEDRCVECQKKVHVFDAAFAPFSYNADIRESIMRFKYSGRAEYARFYAECIWKYGKDRIRMWNPEVIISIPIHASRYAKRGYNQAELIALELSKLSGIVYNGCLIKRKKKTEAQKELGSVQRKNNMHSAFEYVGSGNIYKRVLVVDDILTTGSTLDSAALLLKKNGVKNVWGVCAAE